MFNISINLLDSEQLQDDSDEKAHSDTVGKDTEYDGVMMAQCPIIILFVAIDIAPRPIFAHIREFRIIICTITD